MRQRTQLIAELLYVDPVANLYHPGRADRGAGQGRVRVRRAGATGTQRLVPSINALVEKIKIADAGLEDWVVEMVKVLLLASMAEPGPQPRAAVRPLDGDVIHWVLLGDDARAMQSPMAAYERLAARTQARPKPNELRIDRVWGIAAVQQMMRGGN